MVAHSTGFRPVKSLHGNYSPWVQQYTKAVDQSALSRLAVGDPVALLADGKVARLDPAATGGYIGVVEGVYNSNGRPKTHIDNNSTVSVTADADIIAVNVDPKMVYRVAYDGGVSAALIGRTVTFNAGTVSLTNKSGAYAVATSASSDMPFRVVGVDDSVRFTAVSGDSGYVLVIGHNHVYGSTASI